MSATTTQLLSSGEFCKLRCDTIPVKSASANVSFYTTVSQPPGRGPVPGPGINYTGPRAILPELITNLNVILNLSTCHNVHIIVLILFMIMP